ncbi:precorrin-3B C(17)-methyltransferase [Argonema galeatum]|uniref:precorrin-3B C(17)-methyltransferase n=1 Tax=Argonema galeatum TaxID=2942762 RepID=UPI0020135EE0|nr:precorrin-3B C(17)-methyltransferase [Argonema galeatum]MCL1466263.1 precorrin-3B C(17)-methyltransferase [Argonema galeatum A003/A1]
MSKLLFEEYQPLAAIATTPTAAKRLLPLTQAIGATLWVPESLGGGQDAHPTRGDAHPTTRVYTGSLKEHLSNIWQENRGFIFCLATGAVVRLIAPLLEDKSRDPAVVVIDEAGKFAIALCSGHQGGADKLANAIALQLNATPVITGASAGLGLPAVDTLGVPFGWHKGDGDWTKVAAAISRGEAVQVIQEVGSTLWQSHLPEGHPFYFEGSSEQFPPSLLSPPTLGGKGGRPHARIWISFTQRQFAPESDFPKVQWHPRVLWVGIGCERGTPKQLIEKAIEQVFQANHLALGAIAGIATIDIKADEVGLVEICQEKKWPLRTFPPEVLRSVTVPNPSAVVEAEVGTPSVAEAAAISASGCQTLLIRKQIFRMEIPPQPPLTKGGESDPPLLGGRESSQPPLLRGAGGIEPSLTIKEGKAVTIAIALAEKEYTDRIGKLFLIGTGPGQLNQMTPAAQTAVNQADVAIGYSLYIDLISPLLRPGQIVEALPITQEVQRAKRAIELANWGLTVAVVSSGDCGIYGMAGLVMEELQAQGWDGKIPGVQVFPGITALQSAASRVGAPLMHDFCAISLSDLLTPWEVIERRLRAAAMADFVTALYNPKSKTRTEQIAIAQAIFLQYRDPNTPVALVRDAYRQDEQITLTKLDKMLEECIDMLTTVIIGNSNTRTHAEWMITPRGYKISEAIK